MVRSINADSIHLALSGIAILGLLTWGTYAVLAVSTFPSDQGSIINAALRGVTFTSGYTGNGTVIRPNSEAQFMMVFRTKPSYNSTRGWPESYSVPGGEGYGLGPFSPTQPSSNFSSFEIRYAIFTYSFGGPGVFNVQPAPWVSGPQGNITQPTYGFGSPALDHQSPGPTFGPSTWILEIDSAGNYTLHYFNAHSVNATGRVIMSSSRIIFSRSQPYLYPGLATVVVAAAFSVVTVFVFWRKHRHAPVTS